MARARPGKRERQKLKELQEQQKEPAPNKARLNRPHLTTKQRVKTPKSQ